MNQFVDLHLHSTFSMLDAYGTSKQVIERAKELRRPAIAITDHGSLSAHPSFEKEALAAGIKPIFGEEFYVVSDVNDNQQKKSHLTVLAKNQTGYRNLLKLASESYRVGFYYKPTIDGAMLQRYGEGLVVLSGCTHSPSSRLILDGDVEGAERVLRGMWQTWGTDFYLEVQPTDFEDCQRVNVELKRIAKRYGLPIVVTNDVHYPLDGQHHARRLLWSVRDRVPFDQIELGESHFQLSYDELVKFARLGQVDDVIGEAAEATMRIAADCDVTLMKTGFVKFPLPDGETDRVAFLRRLVVEGLTRRGVVDDPAYRERAEYEFGVVQEKDFVDYFLVVADLVAHAKDRGIMVGPARGSSAGSLLCWALRITEVDPLRFGLMFERFIDITRDDYPDIDVDIEDERRHLVQQYMRDKYGADHVAAIAVFTTFRGKNALDETAKSHGIPAWEVAKVKNVVIQYARGDNRYYNAIEDTFSSFSIAQEVAERYPAIKDAMLIEGQYKNVSQHAAGVVVGPEPLDEFIPLYWREGEALAGYDLEDCKYMGLIKIDLLGLSALTRLRLMAEHAGMTIDDVFAIPLDDAATLDSFRRLDVLGVFQFEGDSMRSVLGNMADVSRGFIDLVDVNALSRPGPFFGGGTNAYLVQRVGGKGYGSIRSREEGVADDDGSLHPMIAERTAETHGQILYQEQILRIAREVGNLSWADTGELRRTIGHTLGVEYFNRFRDRFAEGAATHGIDRATADAIFNSMETFGSYAFNKSHSVSYTILGFWTMWFKAHHPHQFYVTMMATEHDDQRLRQYAREYVQRGGRIFGPNVNRSAASWSLSEELGGIVAGFRDVFGVGDKVAQEIVSKQPYTDRDDFLTRVTKRIVNRRKVEALDGAGCFSDEVNDDFLGLREEEQLFASYRVSHRIGEITPDIQCQFSVVGRLYDRNQKKSGGVNRLKFTLNEAQEKTFDGATEQGSYRLRDHTGSFQFNVGTKVYPAIKDKLWGAKEGDMVRVTGFKKAGFAICFTSTFEVIDG